MTKPGEGDLKFALPEDISSDLVHRFSYTAMAALFGIDCVHVEEKYARQAARCAFDEADRLERELSRFVENSDISRINHLSTGQGVRVSHRTMECLEIARSLYLETGGAFDIAIGSGFDKLELVPGEFHVRAHSDGIRLDLGGIGKGYAVDRMAEVLKDWEVDRALIHAGYSSVLALESPPGGQGWPLTLSAPGTETVLARIMARDQALSGSGIRKTDHILDPREQKPVRLRSAAWVSAPRKVLGESPAAVADALSTAFMILSAQEIEAYCRNHSGLEAWILEPAAQRLLHFPATSMPERNTLGI
ncbi:MAG: FAD:protein FMN transferase [Acidobacteriia bacterium]|nr:FAD:protein FMN transferase [Terriglobia bacterium]